MDLGWSQSVQRALPLHGAGVGEEAVVVEVVERAGTTCAIKPCKV